MGRWGEGGAKAGRRRGEGGANAGAKARPNATARCEGEVRARNIGTFSGRPTKYGAKCGLGSLCPCSARCSFTACCIMG